MKNLRYMAEKYILKICVETRRLMNVLSKSVMAIRDSGNANLLFSVRFNKLPYLFRVRRLLFVEENKKVHS